jgi:hypothetical protein
MAALAAFGRVPADAAEQVAAVPTEQAPRIGQDRAFVMVEQRPDIA